MKKRKNNFIKQQYKLSWDFLKESRNYLYFTIFVFFVFVLIGYFVPALEIVQEGIKNFIKELLEKTENLNQFELVGFIFLNNVQVSFFGIILGALFGIFPLIYIVGNGYVLGFVSKLAVNEAGLGILINLVPHGIFELPAVFISFALGLKLASFILQKNKAESFREYFWNSLRVFLFVVTPLLIVAAIIEGSLIFLGK